MTTMHWIALFAVVVAFISAGGFIYMWKQATIGHRPRPDDPVGYDEEPACTHVDVAVGSPFVQVFGGVPFVSKAYHDSVLHYVEQKLSTPSYAEEIVEDAGLVEARIASYRDAAATMSNDFEKLRQEHRNATVTLSTLFHDHSADGADLLAMVELVVKLVQNKEQALKHYADFVKDEQDKYEDQLEDLRGRLTDFGEANRSLADANERINTENEKMQEYQQVAALVCHGVDILRDVAMQNTELTHVELLSLIKDLYDDMKLFQTDAKVRKERYELASSLMSLAASGAVVMEEVSVPADDGVSPESAKALNESVADMLSKPPFTPSPPEKLEFGGQNRSD